MKEIIERRSIRKYKKDVIDRKDIESILKAGKRNCFRSHNMVCQMRFIR